MRPSRVKGGERELRRIASSEALQLADTLGTSGPPPQLTAGSVNGLPTVDFALPSTSPLQGPSTTASVLGTDEFLIEVVGMIPSVNGAPILATSSQKGLLFEMYANGPLALANVPPVAPFLIGTTSVTGHYHVLGARRFGSGASSTTELRVDGVADASLVGAPIDLTGAASDGLRIPLTDGGSVAEIVVVNGSLSDSSLASVETFLIQKYGL